MASGGRAVGKKWARHTEAHGPVGGALDTSL
jgi:hypothetical protein